MVVTVKYLKLGHKKRIKNKEVWVPGPNSDGDVCLRLSFKHYLEKPVKAFRFGFCAFDKFGDFFEDDVEGYNLIAYAETKCPVNAHKSIHVCFERLFDRHFVGFAELYELEALYEDGTSQRIPLTQIRFKNKGCYIATSVYGSYDCPEVWTLRRFRDDILAKTPYGRAFIKVYYKVSPTLVEWFGDSVWFNAFFKKRLDSLVESLSAKGVENTPYRDKSL